MKNRIRILRAERGWTQSELALQLRISRQAINAVENDKSDPSLPIALRIVEAFKLKIEDVFLDKELIVKKSRKSARGAANSIGSTQPGQEGANS